MRNRILFFITLFILWLLLTLSFNAVEIVLGLVFSLFTVFAAERIYGKPSGVNAKLLKLPWFAVYKLMLLWDIFKGAMDSLSRFLRLSQPAFPEFVNLYSGLKDESALWILANTMTFLPGTIVASVDRSTGIIRVYCALDKSGKCEHALEIALKRYENILMKVYV